MIVHPRTLNRFVLRGRRIQAHSLANDRQALVSLSTFTINGHIKLDGTMEMRRSLPDEETFESLAARVRPLLVKTESVYHGRVLEAIQASIDASESEVPEDLQKRVAGLLQDWSQFDLDSSNVLRFAMQSTKIDGSETTPPVSDTQLAAAWLYGDLVHVDTRGDKSDGLLFPVKERYSAAVNYFAHAAVLSLMTLDLVLELHALGTIDLDQESLQDDVVVGMDELVDESFAYVGPVGSPMPSLDLALRDLPEGFRSFTATELLRQTPANQVLMVLTAGDGATVAEYEAAVSRREEKGGRLHWEALVASSVTFEVSFGVRDGEVTDGRFEGTTSCATTNRMKLAEAVLAREMATSTEVTFHVADHKFFALNMPAPEPEELSYIDVSIDTLYDLVAIENVTRQALKPLTGGYKSIDRALLRRTRLLWEGQVVPFRSSPLPTTAPRGVTPQVIVMSAASGSIADVEIPVPTTCIRHPLMRADSVSGVPESDPPCDQMYMVVPPGETFVAWAPEKREIAGDDDLLHPAAWDLTHFNEQAFLDGS